MPVARWRRRPHSRNWHWRPGLYAGPVQGEKIVPDYGWYDPARGVVAEPMPTGRPLVVVTFYRSYLTAADTGPVDALIEAFRSRGFEAIGLFVPSLKAPGASEWTRDTLCKLTPRCHRQRHRVLRARR